MLALTSALGVLSSPLMALEVYNENDKKLEIYGSIRVFVGGAGYSQDHSSGGNALYGLQTNSHIGILATIGKFKATAELGSEEAGIASTADTTPGFRHLYGEYDFGKGGKLLAGKTDTPTILNGFALSDITGNDDGADGYGTFPAGHRKVQIRYTIAGLAIALVEDNLGSGRVENNAVPRISVAWSHKTESTKLQIGGSYKYYNSKSSGLNTDSNNRLSKSAFHLIAAMEKDFQKFYFTSAINYGMNADLYGEQRTSINLANFEWTSITPSYSSGTDVHRAGIYLEEGFKISDKVKAVIGLGYQATWTNKSINPLINTYMAMFQLPYKLDGHFTITPQVGWYAYASSGKDIAYNSSNELLVSGYDNNAVVALVQFRYDF